MPNSKWLLLPALVFGLCLITGCGADSSTTVIETEQQTEQEIADADAAYDAQYAAGAENYEAESPGQ